MVPSARTSRTKWFEHPEAWFAHWLPAIALFLQGAALLHLHWFEQPCGSFGLGEPLVVPPLRSQRDGIGIYSAPAVVVPSAGAAVGDLVGAFGVGSVGLIVGLLVGGETVGAAGQSSLATHSLLSLSSRYLPFGHWHAFILQELRQTVCGSTPHVGAQWLPHSVRVRSPGHPSVDGAVVVPSAGAAVGDLVGAFGVGSVGLIVRLLVGGETVGAAGQSSLATHSLLSLSSRY